MGGKRLKRIRDLRELSNFLEDDIQFFKREIEATHNQEVKTLLEGRLKEAEWILSNLGVE